MKWQPVALRCCWLWFPAPTILPWRGTNVRCLLLKAALSPNRGYSSQRHTGISLLISAFLSLAEIFLLWLTYLCRETREGTRVKAARLDLCKTGSKAREVSEISTRVLEMLLLPVLWSSFYHSKKQMEVLLPSEKVSIPQACNATSFYHIKQLNPQCHFNSSLLIMLVKEEETSNCKLKIALCIPLFHTCDEDRLKWKRINCWCMYEVAVRVTWSCCVQSEPRV